ncbi:MAG TPA: hypothetical protein VL500_05820 [Candidatus Eisenbacteria bacterium]|nr:hypothetical protein [Candidatus Eisenbacteria bacterium]
MSGNVGTNGGKSGIAVFLGIIVALALGVGVAFYLKSGPDGKDQAPTQGPAIEGAIGNVASPANGQPATVANPGTETVQEQGTAALIATDDPMYLSCLERPLGQGETRDQRVTACNAQLEAVRTDPEPAPR